MIIFGRVRRGGGGEGDDDGIYHDNSATEGFMYDTTISPRCTIYSGSYCETEERKRYTVMLDLYTAFEAAEQTAQSTLLLFPNHSPRSLVEVLNFR